MYTSGRSKISFSKPSATPKATPVDTARINVRFLNTPLVSCSAVIPKPFRAGSGTGAAKPQHNRDQKRQGSPDGVNIERRIGEASHFHEGDRHQAARAAAE